jgi:hypothetical protein
MSALVMFLLVVWGLTYLLTTSVLLRPWRRLMSSAGTLARTLAYCRACTGFWVGLLFALTKGGLHFDFSPHQPVNAIAAALAAMGVTALVSEFVPNYAWSAEQPPDVIDTTFDDDTSAQPGPGLIAGEPFSTTGRPP